MRIVTTSLTLLLFACSKTTPVTTTAPSAVPTGSTPIGPQTAAVDASTWPLPTPELPGPAPIAAVGYPIGVVGCLPEPAHIAGFTSDGAELGSCNSSMGIRCELIDRSGKRRTEEAGGPDMSAAEAKRVSTIEAAMKARGIPELAKSKDDCSFQTPPLKGNFKYGDIKLHVSSGGAQGEVLLVGGSVAGESPVFPFTYHPNNGGLFFHETEINALQLSPDETEIGIVTHTNCGEWCDEFQLARMPVERFAAGVYNDAGFRAYKAGDMPKARELFLRAAYIESKWDLAAYNLACVYAKTGDVKNAEVALRLAIARGGDPVKKRAVKDKDFAAVKDVDWFKKLTTF
jgi:hypothetical protein